MVTVLEPVVEPERRVALYGEYDVVVLGGGPAGIAAAVSASRAGRSTLLVERYGFLGGMGTAAGVTNFCGLHANVHGEVRQVVHGVADDLLGRMAQLGGLNEPHALFGGRIAAQAYDNAAYKIAADDLVTSSGVSLLFHALGAAALMRTPREIDCLLLETKSGRCAVRARVFVDCSGDGDLAAWSGATCEKGDGAGGMLYPTTMFRINGVDPVRAAGAWEKIPALMEEARSRGRKFPRKGAIVRPQKHPVEWRANVTQIANPDGSAVDGTDAAQLSHGEVEGRRQAIDVFRFLREAVPGFDDAYILEVAPQIGIRETRRLRGEYQLTEDDVLGCASFDDSIGVNGWPVEAHVPGDVIFRWPQAGSRGYNHLPFRMLLPVEVDNLLVAGRCASMTHGGQSAARVSGACFDKGQAAGSAADLALRAGVRCRGVDVRELQNRLKTDGAFLG
jgi:hypothetical protein